MRAPNPRPEPTVVRLGDLSAIVLAVDHMLGFRPSESLVAVALTGPRERMSFAMRLDLPPSGGHRAVAAEIALRMAKAHADSVMLFVFTGEEPDAGNLPQRELVDAVDKALAAPVREATLVSGDRMWSYQCADERCCPPEGRPIDRQSPDALALAAGHALLGDVVLGSRDEVVATMQPLRGIAAVSMEQALDRAFEAMVEQGLVSFSDTVAVEIEALTARFDDPRATVSDDEAARVTLALGDKLLRDAMFVRLSEPDDALRRLLHAVARRAQPPDDAAVCTCVGYAAYVDGHGLLASVAFERALDSQPDYVMAQMLAQLLHGQVPPEDVREVGAGIAQKLDRQIRSRRRRGW